MGNILRVSGLQPLQSLKPLKHLVRHIPTSDGQPKLVWCGQLTLKVCRPELTALGERTSTNLPPEAIERSSPLKLAIGPRIAIDGVVGSHTGPERDLARAIASNRETMIKREEINAVDRARDKPE
jgi:hypothetical protein